MVRRSVLLLACSSLTLAVGVGGCSAGSDDSELGQTSDNATEGCAEEPTAVEGTSLLTSVNRQQALKKSFVPELMTIPTPYGGASTELRPLAVGYFKTMAKDVGLRTGKSMAAGSAYRSFGTQCWLFASYAQKEGSEEKANTYAARAGHSEHQLGTVVDVLSGGDYLAGGSAVDTALAALAYKYGFVLSYPEGSTPTTGYIYEPWHFRFVGLRASQEHHRREAAAGRRISTHEFVESLTSAQRTELEKPHPLDEVYLRLAQNPAVDMSASPTVDLCVAVAWVSTCVDSETLLRCDYNEPDKAKAVREKCSGGCQSMPTGQADRCSSDPIQTDPCKNILPGPSGHYCGEGIKGEARTLYYCSKEGTTLSKEQCSKECVVEAPGVPDHCD